MRLYIIVSISAIVVVVFVIAAIGWKLEFTLSYQIRSQFGRTPTSETLFQRPKIHELRRL